METTISRTSKAALKHFAPIRNVSWLPDGRHLFSGDDHGVVLLSEALTGQSLGAFECHGASISALKASPHGQLLATAAVDGTVRVWSYASLREPIEDIHLIGEAKFDGEVAGLDFRPAYETSIGIADASGAVSLWYPLGGTPPRLVTKLPMQANSVAWSPGGRLLAVGCDDCAVHLLDLQANQQRKFLGHTHHADQVGYSLCGRYIASGSHDRTVRVWEAETGECLQVLRHGLDTVKPDWSADGRLVTCSYDKKIRIWDPLVGKLVAVLQGHTYDVDDVAWSPDFRYIASCGWDNCVRVFDGQTYQPVSRMEGAAQQVYALAIDPSRDEMRAGTSASRTFQIRLRSEESVAITETASSHHGVITSIDVSPSTRFMASTSSDGTLVVHDLGKSGRCKAYRQQHDLDIDIARYSECGRYIATGARDSSVVLYRADGLELAPLARLDHERRVKAIAWAPNRPHLATGADGNIRVFDAVTRTCIKQWRAHERMINALRWTPDGEQLISCCWDKLIRVFSRDGELLSTLEGSSYNVNDVDLHGEGDLLASACWDGSMGLWSVLRSRLLRMVPTPDHAPAQLVRWLPGRNVVAVATWGGLVALYDFEAAAWCQTFSLNRPGEQQQCHNYLQIQ